MRVSRAFLKDPCVLCTMQVAGRVLLLTLAMCVGGVLVRAGGCVMELACTSP